MAPSGCLGDDTTKENDIVRIAVLYIEYPYSMVCRLFFFYCFPSCRSDEVNFLRTFFFRSCVFCFVHVDTGTK